MQATRWRSILMGDVNDLRSRLLASPDIEALPLDEIERDIARTFPDKWFKEHHDRIRNVLLWYAWTHPGVSYCQAFSFLAFSLYKMFHMDDPRHSMVDTYYSMHTLISLVRPIFPLNSEDIKPVEFTRAFQSLVHINLLVVDHVLAEKVFEHNIVQFYVLNGVPTLFTNWFSVEEGHQIIEFLLDEQKERMFSNIVNFVSAFILAYREIYMHFTTENLMLYVRQKNVFQVPKIIAVARCIDT